MRYVNRFQIPTPAALSAEQELVKTEKDKAEEYFKKRILKLNQDTAQSDSKEAAAENPENGDEKSFSGFKVYKDELIRKALEKLFFGKCAYCEGRYSSMHPVDIEHWRPKADVFDDKSRKGRGWGYYWLAAEWKNLLPSCIDCNRIRTHFDFVKREYVTLGKGNWFPLVPDSKRAVGQGDERDEEPLLLNPCEDFPENHLEFHEEGFIKAKLNSNNQPDEKALASIRFYALNRAELVRERRERILLIKQKIATIRSLAELFEQESDNQKMAIIIEDLLLYQIEQLHRFQEPDQPFSAMAKQFIEEFIDDLQA